MKIHLAVLSLVVAGLCAAPSGLRAEDAVPPKPPGGNAAPPAASTSPAPDAKKGGPGRMDPAERLKKMTEELGLTQEQQDKIKAVYEKNGPQLKEFMAKGRENLTPEDKAKVGELLKSQREEIGAILTPEQKEKMKAAFEKRRAEQQKPQ